MNDKKLLEVSIIRSIAITLLVVMHSFTIFAGGGWPKPDGVENVELYEYIVAFINGFQMEALVFVSGYIFSFQVNKLKKKYSLGSLLKKKFLRLLLPCWLFGIIYTICFKQEDNFWLSIWSILDGNGHLWFLTMLFWCFVGLFVIDRYKQKTKIFIVLLFILYCMPIPNFVCLGLSKVSHFLFYAYFGYVTFLYKEVVFRRLESRVVVLLLVYICLLVLYCLLESLREEKMGILLWDGGLFFMARITRFFMAIGGIMFLYVAVMKFLRCEGAGYVLPHWLVSFDGVCYGVYIFHQFILEWLYYSTDFPMMLNSYILPFVSFVVVFVLSIFLSRLFVLTKVGRFLIG